MRQEQRLKSYPEPRYSIDAIHVYTLAELIDLVESHNPETHAAWLNAKAEAASVGVSKAALFPAVALAYTSREGMLIDAGFHWQAIGLFQPTLNLNYLIFDFGRRSSIIAKTKVTLIAADFAFNNTH